LIAIFIHINAVLSRVSHIESQIWSVNLERIIPIKISNTEEHRAYRNSQLRDVVFEIEKSKAGFGSKTDGSRSNLYFGARIPVGPEIVARGQWAVGDGIEPVALSAGLKRDCSLHIADAPCTAWGILIILLLLVLC
jgi:hypothetical protein